MPSLLNPKLKPKPPHMVDPKPKPASPSHEAEGDDASTTTAHAAARHVFKRSRTLRVQCAFLQLVWVGSGSEMIQSVCRKSTS